MENEYKVAKVDWHDGIYIYIDPEDGNIKWQNGEMYYEELNLSDEWRIVD
jgi:hypothetical protein